MISFQLDRCRKVRSKTAESKISEKLTEISQGQEKCMVVILTKNILRKENDSKLLLQFHQAGAFNVYFAITMAFLPKK